MAELELSVKDQFIELGNRFFNVKNVEWSNSYDLGYESSTTDPVNKYFIEGEEKVNELYDSLLALLSQLILLLNFKSLGKSIETETTNKTIINTTKSNSKNSKLIYSKYNGSEMYNSTAQYNVSRTLIQKLNEDLMKSNINASINGHSFSKKQNRMKNQPRDTFFKESQKSESQLYNVISRIKKWDTKSLFISHS